MTDVANPFGPGFAITSVGAPIVVPLPTPIPPLVIQMATVNAFTADADKVIAADVIPGPNIPEPSAMLLLVIGSLVADVFIRRRVA
jgi:hypothetical protein